jgi:hypothetical protein
VAAIAMAVTAHAIKNQFKKKIPAARIDSDQQSIIAPTHSLQPGST